MLFPACFVMIFTVSWTKGGCRKLLEQPQEGEHPQPFPVLISDL